MFKVMKDDKDILDFLLSTLLVYCIQVVPAVHPVTLHAADCRDTAILSDFAPEK